MTRWTPPPALRGLRARLLLATQRVVYLAPADPVLDDEDVEGCP